MSVDIKQKKNMVSSFINNLNDWNIDKTQNSLVSNVNSSISNAENYNIINFFKTFIQNIIKTFPNMLLNKVDYKRMVFPSHWNLARGHYMDILNGISKYYKPLNRFLGTKKIKNLISFKFQFNQSINI